MPESQTFVSPLKAIVVVGASLAGLRAVESLRERGYEGRLVWIGEELQLPYDRPPLSKEILQGKWEADRLALRRKPYEDLDVELRLGRRATGLDLAARAVALDDGTREAYDALLIATGARPRPLPNPDHLAGIYLLRTMDDSLALRAAFEGRPRVVVVGAGFIGAEVAASARARGLEVAMVEPQPAPLMRGLGRDMGDVIAAVHRDHGVDVRCGISVAGFEGGERVEAVRLSDGTVLAADVVVVGIGATPATDWLVESGLTLSDGVVCDTYCRAGAPGVFAAGDVARFHNPLFDETMRIEHWSNAVEQGVHAAANMLDEAGATPYVHVPWFWSHQYDVKIQSAGRMRDGDEMRIVSGSLEKRKFAALYGRSGRLTGVLAINQPRALLQFKKLLAAGSSWEAALAAA